MKIERKKRYLVLLFISLSIFYSLIFVMSLKLVTATSLDSNFSYYSSEYKNTLPLSKEMLAVRFKQGITSAEQEVVINSEGNLASFSERQELLTSKLTLLPLQKDVTEENIIQIVKNLNNKSEIEFVSLVFHFSDAELILTDEFVVKFDPSVSEAEIEAFNKLNNVEIVRKPEWTNRYTLRVKYPKNMDALKIANLYYENPITIFSMPNFIRKLEALTVTPNDTYFPDQWALNNTGQDPPAGTPDADIDAPEGWEISIGSPDIVIAIIDEGVDLNHEDLKDKIVDGYDFVDDDNNATPLGYDAHGTACAGLAAAETNNSKGISGVCWNCKIMPVRIAYDNYWTTDEWAANGIEWAADHGADVLSNSWYFGPDSDIIHDAIIEAKNNGRNGKGCVIVFASGNSGESVFYPANYTEVIAVGATNASDAKWDYSNYGGELDVVAPSAWGSEAGVIFWTTDITGSAGYNDGDVSEGDEGGNYTKWFGGTSAATPEVAGLAGLILSVNPDLSSNDTQSIIESTADDKGASGWDQYYGWGRINVYNALKKAMTYPKINQIQCHNSTNWTDCPNILYGSNLTQVRANCTSYNKKIVNVTFKLENIPDNKTFFNHNATSNETDWWIYDNDDAIINDSGEFKLTVTCFDNESSSITDYETWIIPFGKLSPYLITGNKYAIQNKFFNFTSGVKCVEGECGNISSSLYYFVRNFTTRTCSGVWGFNCGDGPAESGDNTFDDCNYGDGGDESVENIYINATSVMPGDVINVTCEFYPTENSDYDYMWYFNGSGWRNVYDEPSKGKLMYYNVSVNIMADNIIGTHWIRCRITDGENDDECINTSSFYDNDDISFNVGEKIPVNSGKPFYTTSPNPQNSSHSITFPPYCLSNMHAGDSCNQTWKINATGELDSIWELFTKYSPINYLDAEGNLTNKANITIIKALNDTSKVYVRNSSNSNVAWLGSQGNIVLAGGCYNSSFNPSEDDFTIKNSSGSIKSYIDNLGNLFISEGSCDIEYSSNCNPAGNAFIIQNIAFNNMTYTDFNGKLCLKGGLYEFADNSLLGN